MSNRFVPRSAATLSPIVGSPEYLQYKSVGLSHTAALAAAKAEMAEQRKLLAKEAQTVERVKVRREAISYLLGTTVVIGGKEMNGIEAIQYHLAFTVLVGSQSNPSLPLEFAQSIVNETWKFIRETADRFGGKPYFPMDAPSLKKIVLLADGIEGMSSWLDEELAYEESLVPTE